jgi:Lamin Tail Domain
MMHELVSTNWPKNAMAVLLCAALAACGGGGGGGASTPSGNSAEAISASNESKQTIEAGEKFFGFNGQSVAKATLLISEIANNAGFTNDASWFEVYNPGTTAINLSAYKLRSSSFDRSDGTRGSSTFTLPSVEIPPQGFMVLTANIFPQLEDGPKMRYLENEANVPGWTDSGFLELIRLADNTTDDFVRFGSDDTAPTTPGAWRGNALSPLRIGESAYGKSVVRLASRGVPDTNTKFDWSRVNFATPGGPNDVDPGVTDSDRDGIPDTAKVPGGTFAGLDLYAMGARAGGRDIFLELHHMANDPASTSTDVALTPQKAALQKVVDAFAVKGIRFHIDVGSLYSTTFNPGSFNLGGGAVVPFAKCTKPPVVTANNPQLAECANFYASKNTHFDVRRRTIFHFGLFASSQNADGSAGSSGVAEVNGNDLMITLGQFGLNTESAIATNIANNIQASTLMHEFGHNLGLLHGGFEDTNYKPNYVSLMNYTYQLPGLPGSVNTISAVDRYKLYVAGLNNDPDVDVCDLSNSPCGNTYKLDYSNGASVPFFEEFLIEGNLLGRGSLSLADYADWNSNKALDVFPYALDLNRDGKKELLRDYDDWSSIKLPFARTFGGFNSGSPQGNQSDSSQRFNPMLDMGKQMLKEDAPSPMMMRLMRK